MSSESKKLKATKQNCYKENGHTQMDTHTAVETYLDNPHPKFPHPLNRKKLYTLSTIYTKLWYLNFDMRQSYGWMGSKGMLL